jgi:putative ABC transport system ATP-binding protein
MGLLDLEHITKGYGQGARRKEVLREVSVQVHEHELVAIWGPARSGRSTLLRVAAGIEAPDNGVVCFRGRPLGPGGVGIAGGVAYCRPTLRSSEGQVVLEELIAAQLALGVRQAQAKARARDALERVQATNCEGQRPSELERGEEVRVAIARALLQDPAVLLIDDPIKGVDPRERDRILQLLHSLSRERASIMITIDSGVGLGASDRALSLGEGRLRGHLAPQLAPVVELPLRMSG